MKRKKSNTPKPRNWLAIHAFNRKGGAMKNKKKIANKTLCRKKVRA